jgi:hypothetical protein
MEKIASINICITMNYDGYSEMDPEMDNAFSTLFSGFLEYSITDINSFVSIYFPEFEKAAIAYYTIHPITTPIQNQFINNLTPIWNSLRTIKRFEPAQHFWKHVLKLINHLETHFQTRIHKGAIYYYWGGTAIQNGEIEKGYELMNLALLEDEITYGEAKPGTPAYKYVYLDYTDTNQHFIYLLLELAYVIDKYLPIYKSLRKSNLDCITFRNRFIAAHPKPEVVLLLGYTLSRINQRLSYPQLLPENEFAGILDLNLLFDLTLVIDTSIRAKSNAGWQFFNLARCISNKSGLDLYQNRLECINKELEKPDNFADLVISLLNKSLTMPDRKLLSEIATDIALAYCIRNHAAHNIAPQKLVPQYTERLLQALFDVLFLTVDTFY